MRKQIKDQTKSERLCALQALLAEQAEAFNRATVGRRLPVLLERDGRYPGQRVGRTPYLQAVHVSAPEAGSGDLVEVEITDSHAHSLAGRLLAPGAARQRRATSREACV